MSKNAFQKWHGKGAFCVHPEACENAWKNALRWALRQKNAFITSLGEKHYEIDANKIRAELKKDKNV